MSSEHKFSPPVSGGTSLLIIFSVLCLTIFALLSLSTVQANCRLSDASINASLTYYAADQKAESVFSQLRHGEIPDAVMVSGNLYSYSCPISETQVLNVVVRKDNDSWTVLRWQAESLIHQSQ